MNLLLPLALTGAAWWVARKVLNPSKRAYLPAMAVQIGHLLWLSLGLAYLRMFGLDLVDVVVLVIGVTWLAVKPGLAPVLFLAVFQVLGLGVNLLSFIGAAVGSNAHKALLVHMIWRLLALALMWYGYVQARKGTGDEVAPTGS